MTKEEAIRRLSEIRADYSCFDDDERPKYHALSMAIEALSAERTGEWIEHDPKTKGLAKIYECPFCGDEVVGEKTNFCPNCGAKMKGADDE